MPAALDAAARPETRLRRDLRAILAEGGVVSLMVGFGETYFSAFALAVGVGQVSAGLTTTVPLVIGALLQLCAPWGVRRMGSHRRWVVLLAGCQAATFVPLMIAACIGELPPTAVFLIIACYWGAGMSTSPAWNTWVSSLVPARMRASYFAKRTRLAQSAVLCGFLGGGIALEVAAKYERSLLAFALIFAVAGMARAVSVVLLSSQSESSEQARRQRHVPLPELRRQVSQSGEGRVLVYLVAIQAAVQISGPYFTPFMLKQLSFSYGQYAMLIGTSYLFKVIAAGWWGQLAKRCGARRLLWCGGLGIIPVSSLWLVSRNFYYLFLVQSISGIVWAAYELAMFLLLLDSIDEERRVSVLTVYNFAAAAATALGSLGGGLLLATLGQTSEAYLALFATSSVVRLSTVLLLARVPHLTSAQAKESRRRASEVAVPCGMTQTLRPSTAVVLRSHRVDAAHAPTASAPHRPANEAEVVETLEIEATETWIEERVATR